MSWINLGEVHYILRRLHGDDASETVRDLRDVIEARLPDEPSCSTLRGSRQTVGPDGIDISKRLA